MEFGNEFLAQFVGGQFATSGRNNTLELWGEISTITYDGRSLRVEFTWLARHDPVRKIWREEDPVPFTTPLQIVGQAPNMIGRPVVLHGDDHSFCLLSPDCPELLEKREVLPRKSEDLGALARELETLPLEELDRRANDALFHEGQELVDVYISEYRRRNIPLPA